MRKWTGLFLVVLLVLGMSNLAFASRPIKNQFAPEPLWSQGLSLSELLNLSEEQIKQFKSIRQEYLEKVSFIRSTLNRKDISSSYRNRLRSELSGLFEEYWGKVRAILTPVQLEKLSPRRIATIFLYEP